MDDLPGGLKDWKIIAAIFAGIIIFLYASTMPRLEVVVPSPEGVIIFNYGTQLCKSGTWTSLYSASNAESLSSEPYFYWAANDPSSTILGHLQVGTAPMGGYVLNGPGWWYDHGAGKLRSEVQRHS